MFNTIKAIVGGLGNALFPALKKSALLDQIESVNSRLSTKTIPAYNEAYSVLGGKKFKDTVLQKMDANVRSSLGSSVHGYNSQQNMIYGILSVLKNAQSFITAVHAQADKIFASSNPTGALKLRQAYIITMVNSASFADQYARMLLNYIYSREMCAVSGSDEYKLVNAYDKKITEGFDRFISAIRSMNRPAGDVSKHLERISEYATADDQSLDAMLATQSMNDIDPMRLGYLTDFSPFYILGMWEAEIRAWFVRQTEDELELLTRRRIRLEQLYAGQNDAFADKEIDAIQRRIDDAQADMDDYKRRYKF